MLREIQETEGCIPIDAQEIAAEKLGIKRSVFTCIMKRIPDLKEANYSHELVLCTGERCQNKNSLELLEAVKKELKIAKDGISADKKVKLTTQNCMKQCRTSPNMKIDGKLYTGLTKEKVLELIRGLK
ncbi:MAG TPA: NAD(P)H-dependent oxidoreductase subunit E [Candidatus Blautia stercoravium]|nr:NAD(P)H-dependent oxidoreductase subunit E [Candidatus Blautia stercoravium]